MSAAQAREVKKRLAARCRPWVLLVLLAAVVVLPGAALSSGPTSVSGTISTNTTWTTAGSPYVVNGNVSVAAGVTLTIDPGVVVKFNGTTRQMWVYGTLTAVGTQASPVIFTSIQDDSVGGDSNGDGTATSPAPGQWFHVGIEAGTASELRHVNVRYGGWGSGGWAYGAIEVNGQGTSATIDHATITDNQSSGIKMYLGGATISASTISNNGLGIAANEGWVVVKDRTLVKSNTYDGLWFNLSSSYVGPASSVVDSDVAENGRYGVYIGASGDLPLAKMPRGSGNNLFANLDSSGEQLVVSGYPSFKNAEINWRGNYWGDDVYYYANPAECASTAPNASGRLAYRSSTTTPPVGPIGGGTYVIWKPYPQTPVVCGYSTLAISECSVASHYIERGLLTVEFEQAKPVEAAMTCAGDALFDVKELETNLATLTDDLTAGYVPSPGQTQIQVVADYEPMIESLVQELNSEGGTTYSYPGSAPVARMLLSAAPTAPGPLQPLVELCDDGPWWPTAGRIYVGPTTSPLYWGQRYVYQEFWWNSTNLERLECYPRVTYEPDANFDVTDGLHYLGARRSFVSNLPRKYLDQSLLDQSDFTTYTVGTGDAKQLVAGKLYKTIVRTLPGNASADVAWATGQSGFHLPFCHQWWCIDGRESWILTGNFTVPGGASW